MPRSRAIAHAVLAVVVLACVVSDSSRTMALPWDFTVRWECPPDGRPGQITVPPEASGKTISLGCDPPG
jgi:hypothetical protein